MTYHPKSIIACALFLATKAEHFHVSPTKFAEETNVTEDDVKAPEFLVLQGIKFTLDVRHPFKGLDGWRIEVGEMIELGRGRFVEGEVGNEKRVKDAATRARAVLVREAQMTDVYFFFTPAQICMASLRVVDEELLEAYLDAKFEDLVEREKGSEEEIGVLKGKVREAVGKCAEMLSAYQSPEDKKQKKELGRIGKKLAKCQDPEKLDIVAVARAKKAEKREGSESERERDGEKKKRKMERDKGVKDGDVFGGELKDVSK
jgi:cyclin H